MKYKFKDGELVPFDNGAIRGMGQVLGVSTSYIPPIGVNYIIKPISSHPALPTPDFPFSVLTIFECHISGFSAEPAFD